ncbi:peptide/nickel transport system substrate-binding protein [Polaromonas sp. OV174]|uniref:ABC transporter substrate-binding protein n=1 Tax=Polaromonas sp. OV174 TaxID=1855300 RepID=UPI0008E64E74|nr:ABC transporter substrate-binding protein [Polaromonas sp. OV174]SFC63483.1 peptide/nickel transport system substrate-binding protein [Polaromonas sp. OV174]
MKNNKNMETSAGGMGRRGMLLSMASFAALWGHGASAQSVDVQHLQIASATEPSAFDPHFQYFGPNRQAHMPVFEPLAMYGPQLDLQPALAKAWRATAENVWEIELRPQVLFHDGTPFTAQDVIFSLERATAMPNSPSSMGVYSQSIATITAVDDLTLRVETKGPSPLLIYDLANIPILSKRVSGMATTESFNAGVGVVGTGPFRFVAWTKGKSIRYEAFDRHWAGRSSWRSVEVVLKADGKDRVNALLTGNAQLIDQVPPSSIAGLRAAPGVSLSETASNFLLFLHMDQARPVTPYITDKQGGTIGNPLRDVRVRKAMSMAIDRASIVKSILQDSATAAAQLLPASFEGTLPDLQATPYDPAGALELLKAAGYPDGFRLVMHGTKGRYVNDEAVLQAIASGLKKVGIDAVPVSLSSNEFFARASSGSNGEPEFSVIQVGWASVEPSGALKGLLATSDKKSGFGSSNRGRYSNQAVDALLQKAIRTVNAGARARLLQQATQTAIVDDQGIIPLYYPNNTWATKAKVKFVPRVDSSTFPMDASLV